MAEWSRWDTQKSAMKTRFVGICNQWMAARSPGTADSQLEPSGKKGDWCSGRLFGKLRQVMVDIDVVERLLRPENLEVSLRYVLKHGTSRGSNIFQLFDTSEKPNHFVASRRRWLESQGRDGARQENGQNEWYDLEYQGAKAKAPPCPDSTLPTSLASAKLVVG